MREWRNKPKFHLREEATTPFLPEKPANSVGCNFLSPLKGRAACTISPGFSIAEVGRCLSELLRGVDRGKGIGIRWEGREVEEGKEGRGMWWGWCIIFAVVPSKMLLLPLPPPARGDEKERRGEGEKGGEGGVVVVQSKMLLVLELPPPTSPPLTLLQNYFK